MNIIYVTTAMDKDDFNEYQSHWKIALNPSNQNFHNKIIRSLALTHDVNVISIRPYSSTMCDIKRLKASYSEKDGVKWNYIKVSRNRFFRYLSNSSQAKKISSGFDKASTVVITDTINPKAIRTANAIAKKYGYPIIGMCTDSPSNITGTPKRYISYLLKQSKNLSGYISLTAELNTLFNKEGKPNIVLEGIVENNSIECTIDDSRYLFFGGAMLPRYGVYNLIEAFKKINDNVQLILCGHHYNEEKIYSAIGEDSRIKFLGIISVDEVKELQSHALACVNPRPFSEDLDRFSIPSKTIESLASGSVTISVKNSKLQKIFPNDIIWAKTGQPDDLKTAIEKVLSLSDDELLEMGRRAKNKVLGMYSLEAVNRRISDLLIAITKN